MWQLDNYPGPKMLVSLDDINVTGTIKNQGKDKFLPGHTTPKKNQQKQKT